MATTRARIEELAKQLAALSPEDRLSVLAEVGRRGPRAAHESQKTAAWQRLHGLEAGESYQLAVTSNGDGGETAGCTGGVGGGATTAAVPQVVQCVAPSRNPVPQTAHSATAVSWARLRIPQGGIGR